MSLPASIAGISLDFIILGALFAVVFFFTWRRGIASGGAVLIALYIAGFVYQNVPVEKLTLFSGSPAMAVVSKIIIFVVLAAVVWWLVARTLLLSLGGGGTSLFVSIGLSAAIIVLLLTYSYHLIGLEPLYNFGSIFDTVFAPEANFLWLILAPLAVLLLV